ncbi:MAG: TAXI family TRAP transporter solute-binding subunit [Alphaproteobacteria bacterium]|nr:TAXI family TRAP transporter solute-binding subunit [Alphaproteobacteria bacterium]
MTRWGGFFLGLCLAVLGALISAPPQAAANGGLRFITIGTGGASSTYRAVGQALCDVLTRVVNNPMTSAGYGAVRCAAPATGGSTYNINQLAYRAFNFGLAQSDWQHHAYHGTAPHQVRPYKGLRSVFSIYPEPFHIVVRRDSGIARFEDLEGKRVNIGNPGAGHRGTMEVLMKAYGMGIGDLGKATELTSVEQTRALCNGTIDAFTLAANAPHPQIALATNRCGARIISLDGPVERKLVQEQPYYAFFTLPKGTYETMDRDVTTFGVLATLVTRATASEHTVYAMVRAVMLNMNIFRQKNPALRSLDPRKMISEGLSAPLHPGALRYYREQGWIGD